jgi:hypothetical protein
MRRSGGGARDQLVIIGGESADGKRRATAPSERSSLQVGTSRPLRDDDDEKNKIKRDGNKHGRGAMGFK